MDLEKAAIPIARRNAGTLLDLAVQFYRAHGGPILQLSLAFAAVCVPLAWAVARYLPSWAWWFGPMLFFVVSPFLGAILVAGAGHRLFGERFTARGALGAARQHLWRLGWSFLGTRFLIMIASLAFLFPGVLVGVRYGFLAEMHILEQSTNLRNRSRATELTVNARVGLNGRWMLIAGFFALLAFSCFWLVDYSLDLVGYPVLIGRIPKGLPFDAAISHFFSLLFVDPWVVGVHQLLLWLLYPLARLAWFFCYLDVRIRKEGWDLELDFRVEARRLQARSRSYAGLPAVRDGGPA